MINPIRPLIAVIATREKTYEDFYTKTPTGRWLRLYAASSAFGVDARVFLDNTEGLGTLYNRIIQNAPALCNVVFMHDDLELCDFWWAQRVEEGLQQYDVIGLAGSTRRVPNQVGWGCLNTAGQMDDWSHFSGFVGGCVTGLTDMRWELCSPAPRRVVSLDGLFIATRIEHLRRTGVLFDEQFKFHHYDIDFSRQCVDAGLTLGTWPISVIHRSRGSMDQSWRDSCELYLKKWGH